MHLDDAAHTDRLASSGVAAYAAAHETASQAVNSAAALLLARHVGTDSELVHRLRHNAGVRAARLRAVVTSSRPPDGMPVFDMLSAAVDHVLAEIDRAAGRPVDAAALLRPLRTGLAGLARAPVPVPPDLVTAHMTCLDGGHRHVHGGPAAGSPHVHSHDTEGSRP